MGYMEVPYIQGDNAKLSQFFCHFTEFMSIFAENFNSEVFSL